MLFSSLVSIQIPLIGSRSYTHSPPFFWKCIPYACIDEEKGENSSLCASFSVSIFADCHCRVKWEKSANVAKNEDVHFCLVYSKKRCFQKFGEAKIGKNLNTCNTDYHSIEENLLSSASAGKSIDWRVFLMLCKCDKSISFAQLKYGFEQDKKLKPAGFLKAVHT